MLVLSGVFIIVGAVLVVGGGFFRDYQKSREAYRGRADGQVIELIMDKPDEEGERAGAHHYYYPLIAYYANGLLYKGRYEKGGNPGKFKVNQELKLCYDLEKPYHFKILEKKPIEYLAEAAYFAGFLFCIAGGITFLLFAVRG